jgi:hypothetical protein
MSEGSGDRSGCRGPKRILGAVVPPFELPDLLSIPFERKHTVREFSEDEKRFLSTRQQILLRRNPEKLRQERATLAAMTDEEREAYLGPPTEDEPVGDRPQVQDGSKTPKRNLAAAAKFRSGTMKGCSPRRPLPALSLSPRHRRLPITTRLRGRSATTASLMRRTVSATSWASGIWQPRLAPRTPAAGRLAMPRALGRTATLKRSWLASSAMHSSPTPAHTRTR